MIYKNTPKPKNTYAKILALVCILTGAALFILANVGIFPAPAVPQLVGLIFITVSIYTASAFLLRQYTFSLDLNTSGERDGIDFIVTERKGKRDVTVCRFGIDDIVAVREVNAQNKKQVNAEREKMKRYTYDTAFIAPRRIELICKLDDDDFSILVTYDEQLLAELKKLGK